MYGGSGVAARGRERQVRGVSQDGFVEAQWFSPRGVGVSQASSAGHECAREIEEGGDASWLDIAFVCSAGW